MASDSAHLPYHGSSGVTRDCEEAIQRIIQFGDEIVQANILSHENSHGFLLRDAYEVVTAILPGFATGYGGEGPRRFSYVLRLLNDHYIPVDEYDIPSDMMKRFEASALTHADLNFVEKARPIRPHRYNDYIWEMHWKYSASTLWKSFKPVLPLSLIEPRLADLAKKFGEDPDKNLMTGYRRLEDAIRQKTDSDKHGSKLMSEAFMGKKSVLIWEDIDDGEQTGRGQLFTGTYMAHRNPRAHREKEHSLEQYISEFLLLNHLFHLEASSVVKSDEEE